MVSVHAIVCQWYAILHCFASFVQKSTLEKLESFISTEIVDPSFFKSFRMTSQCSSMYLVLHNTQIVLKWAKKATGSAKDLRNSSNHFHDYQLYFDGSKFLSDLGLSTQQYSQKIVSTTNTFNSALFPTSGEANLCNTKKKLFDEQYYLGEFLENSSPRNSSLSSGGSKFLIPSICCIIK